MNGSHGFQFTPIGIIPLSQQAPSLGDIVSGGTSNVASEVVPIRTVAPADNAERARPLSESSKTSASRPGFDPKKPLTGRQLMAHARARIREIDRTLRKVDDLRTERASLAALIAAATPRKTDA